MVFKCKICGGNLEIEENRNIATCEYCGSKQTLPKLENDKIANLYDRANHFRRNNEYDKAEALYEMLLNEDPKDGEAYWSLVLCQFGVEYVEDPKTHAYIPTCNRTQNVSILTNENYKQALKYATEEQKELYKEEASKINTIQRGILEISSKEEPFDIFICYKETDEEGRRTQDSVIAQELYYQLVKEGFRVFFAKITLENKIGESYEPYIYAALNSAKVMLVIGTKKEYFEAVWVKNEWSRYLGLIKNGEKKTLIPCYKDMDAYSLPQEFAYLQAQDMSKLGFEQDLIHGIKKLVDVKEQKKQSGKPMVIIGVILFVIVVLGIAMFLFGKNPSIFPSVENSITEEKTARQILKKDFASVTGHAFNMKVENLKTQLMEYISTTEYADRGIEARDIELEDGSYSVAIGWFYEEDDVIGITIETANGEDVTSISCVPPKYGSGDIESLTIPIDIYEQAKKILGSDTAEWKELMQNGEMEERIYDYWTGEEYSDGEMWAGRIKFLSISKNY